MTLCTLGYGLDPYGSGAYGSPAVTLVLTVGTPLEGMTATAGSQVLVSGTVTPGALVWVDGQDIPVDPSGAFATFVEVLVGPNTVTVQAGCDTPALTVTRLVFGMAPVPLAAHLPDGGILSPGVYPGEEESP